MGEPTLAQALVLAKEHLALLRALDVIADAVEQAGGIASVVHELEQERDLLEIEVATLKRERQRAAGADRQEEDDHE